jgi:hypothetical protein
MDSKQRTMKKAGLLTVVLSVLVIMTIGAMGPLHTMTSGNINNNAVTTSETGKAVYSGNGHFNVSWVKFANQASVTVYFSQASSVITDKTQNVTVTTANYTTISTTEIGPVFILIQNGTTFPTTTGTEFQANMELAYELETFKVDRISTGLFNVSWAKFKDQSQAYIYYASGNGSMVTSKSAVVSAGAADFSIIQTGNGTEYSFLLVNGTLFPAFSPDFLGDNNLTNYTVTVANNYQPGGGFILDGYAIYLSWEVWATIGAGVLIIVGVYKLGKHHERHRKN